MNSLADVLSGINAPLLSVVMSVFNGSRHLAGTIESVLNQTFGNFEFIIVNDGSTDDSLTILKQYQTLDARIRIIDQPNLGLTIALNNGCNIAVGEYIFRQDVGDISLPTRFELQLAVFDLNPAIVAVGVGCRRIGPAGEFLGNQTRSLSPQEVTNSLLNEGVGLCHASSAFRRDSFELAGGYRAEFRCAQDADLWLRLASFGMLAECSEILFEVQIETTGISGTGTRKQVRLWQIARECHEARIKGQSDAELLNVASVVSKQVDDANDYSRLQDICRANYFIGSLLFGRRDPRCRSYLFRSLDASRRCFPGIVKLLSSYILCRRPLL